MTLLLSFIHLTCAMLAYLLPLIPHLNSTPRHLPHVLLLFSAQYYPWILTNPVRFVSSASCKGQSALPLVDTKYPANSSNSLKMVLMAILRFRNHLDTTPAALRYLLSLKGPRLRPQRAGQQGLQIRPRALFLANYQESHQKNRRRNHRLIPAPREHSMLSLITYRLTYPKRQSSN
jgi:hypothetical protein